MTAAAAIGRSRAAAAAVATRGVDEFAGARFAVVTSAAAIAMLPLLVPHGPANLAPVDPVIALALLASLVCASATGHRWRFPYVLPVGLFVVAGALGALAGPVPVGGLVALLQDVWLLAWCICLAYVCRTAHGMDVILRTWAYSAVAWAAILLVGVATGNTHLTGIQSNLGGRTSLTFGDPNYAAHYFFLSMMVIAATRCPPQRSTRVLAYSILLPAWALSGSNSGIVELLLGISLIAILAVYRRSGAPAAVAMVCFALLASALLLPRAPLSHIQEAARASQHRVIRDWVGRSQRSTEQRQELIRESVDLYFAGGAFGQGPTSTITRLNARQVPLARESHNDYLAALVERGFLGGVAIILLVGSVLVRTSQIIRRRLATPFAAVVPSTAPLLAAVAGTLVLGLVYEVLHARHVWALFGIVAALAVQGKE